LRSDLVKRIEKLGRSKPRAGEIVPPETVRRLTELSREANRQLGLLMDRRGQVSHILVGDRRSVFIPDLRLYRFSPGNLRGLRLIHTHLDPEGLTREDLTDLSTSSLLWRSNLTACRARPTWDTFCQKEKTGGLSSRSEPPTR